MVECETLQVGIQRFKLKKSIAAIILLELLEVDGKRESRRGKTRGWIKRRKEKGYFNNMIVGEMMMEDTSGYCEMIWMTRDDFLEILQLTESDITPRQVTKIDQKICFFIVPFPFLSFAFVYDSALLQYLCPHFLQHPPKLLLRLPFLKHWTSNVHKQDLVSMDTSRWASVIRMCQPNMFDTLSKWTKHHPYNTTTKEMF